MEHSGPGVTTPSESAPFLEGRTEAEEVSLAARGDRRAFERLYRKHVARINSLCRRMAGYDEAHEITQDVFVRAWQKLGTFRGESQFGTWLYRLAINVILAWRGKMAVQRGRYGGSEEVLDVLPGRPAQSDLSLDFETAIEKLPEGARQIFVLHDVEGFKHEEIARMLGVTSGTSKAQLHRARMMLRRTLTKGPGA